MIMITSSEISTFTAAECLSVAEAIRYGKLSRSLLYELMKLGEIKSFVRKSHPLNKSGTRFVLKGSIDEFLRSQAEAAGAV
jgi:hypothetical protein